MTLVRFSDPYSRMFGRFVDDESLFGSNRHFSRTNTTLPSVNIRENKDGFVVELAAPGFSKNDFNVELNKDVLTIASNRQEKNDENANELYTRREFSYQSFSRSFTLPNTVEGDRIEAKYENGILRVAIPKKEEAKPRPARMIEIL